MEKKLQKIYHTYFSLSLAQDLWQAHCQILSITSIKEFIKLYVNTDMMTKNVKHAELSIKNASAFLNTQTLKMI